MILAEYDGSVSYVEEGRKALTKDVHWVNHLGVHLITILDSGLTFKNGVESSLVVDVKEKQWSDIPLNKQCNPLLESGGFLPRGKCYASHFRSIMCS